MTLLVSDLPSWLYSLVAFLFGAAWGSFFNVAIYRWPREISVVTPPSHCPGCNARIPARHNLPIVGYLLLRGRAACCGTPLSPRYPIVEALGAVLCVAIVQRFVVAMPPGTPLLGAVLEALCYFVFAGGLVVATFVDLEWMEIPDEVSLPGAALGLATAGFRAEPGVASAALGAGGGFLFVQVLFVWAYEVAMGRRGMGEGDSKLLMMIGAFLGWQGAAFALFAGAAQGILVAAYGLLAGKSLAPDLDRVYGAPDDAVGDEDGERPGEDEDGGRPGEARGDEDAEREEAGAGDYESEPPPRWVGHLKLPFGPFLALAALEYLLWGQTLTGAWFRLVDGLLGAAGFTT